MSLHREQHAATVTSVDDPEQRGRIRVVSASLLGDDETELPMWVEPALTWGQFTVPNVGEEVEIEVSASSDNDEIAGQASVEALSPVWKGVRHYDVDAETPAAPINDDFKGDGYGKKRGFQTPGGHTLVYDDNEGVERIALTWRNANGKVNSIVIIDDLVTIAVDGAQEQSAAVAEPLQALYESMKSTIEATYNAHVHPSAMGPTGVPAVPLNLPTWDAMINAARLKIPGNGPSTPTP